MHSPETLAPETLARTPALTPTDVVRFWREVGEARWFKTDPALDGDIRTRFGGLAAAALMGGLDSWNATAEGALALVLLLDQFPRNMHRGTADAFAGDAKARAAAGAAIASGLDLAVEPAMRIFFYMPFMHSEQPGEQNRSVALFAGHAPANLSYAQEHRDIILRFGRFPHRNLALGRRSTPAERAFLQDGGFAG